MLSVLAQALKSYADNLRLISFFSIPFLIAFPVSLLLPSFVTVGATLLRFGSLPNDISALETALIVAFIAVSLLLMSFAIVAINTVIKSQKTQVLIRRRTLEEIEYHTFRVFWLLVFSLLLSLFANMLLYDYGLSKTLGMLVNFAIWLPIVYAPAAVVIDDLQPVRAMQASIGAIRTKPVHFVFWLALGALMLTAIDLLGIAIGSVLPVAGRYAALVLNALLVLPFLVVLQTQIYISKYTIL